MGAVCAIPTPVSFVTGGILLNASGVEVLIQRPASAGSTGSGTSTRRAASSSRVRGRSSLTTLVAIVALVGFYDLLKDARLGRGRAALALAVIKTSAVPRWIGWVGLFSAVVAGWLGLLSPASDAIEGTTVLGFLAFFVFMLGMGIAVLLRQRRLPRASQ